MNKIITISREYASGGWLNPIFSSQILRRVISEGWLDLCNIVFSVEYGISERFANS